jgi:hypothetical protein
MVETYTKTFRLACSFPGQCTDVRDKLYAFLGLSKEHMRSPRLIVDYSQSPTSLFFETMRKLFYDELGGMSRASDLFEMLELEEESLREWIQARKLASLIQDLAHPVAVCELYRGHNIRHISDEQSETKSFNHSSNSQGLRDILVCPNTVQNSDRLGSNNAVYLLFSTGLYFLTGKEDLVVEHVVYSPGLTKLRVSPNPRFFEGLILEHSPGNPITCSPNPEQLTEAMR